MRYIAFVLAVIVWSQAHAGSCVPTVQPSTDADVAYRDRGDRCEGLYQQPVAASAGLKIIGLHGNAPRFAAGSRAPLLVAATVQELKNLNLRIVSRQPQKYYRLDASLGLASKFIWKRDVINDVRVGISQYDIAALMCEGSCETKALRIYPVAIAEHISAPVIGATVWLRSAVNLKKLAVTVEGEHGILPHLNGRDVLEGAELPGGIAKDVFLDVPAGEYRLRAVALPSGANAPDEARATLVLR